MAWKIYYSPFFKKRFERFKKKHFEEYKAVLDNLDTYFNTLQDGVNPINIKAGFLHKEPDGIKAIDQKGSEQPNLSEIRLYVYPETVNEILHVISIGGKQKQGKEINECRIYIKPLKRRK